MNPLDVAWHRVNHFLPFYLVSQRNASAIPPHYISPGSHSIGSIHPAIWGVTLYTPLAWWIGGEQVNHAPSGGQPPASTLGSCWCFNSSDFALLLVHLGVFVTGKFYEDLEVPFFADHIRALTESFDSNLAGVLNPLFRQLGRYWRWPRFDQGHLKSKQRVTEFSRPVEIAR